MYEVLWKVSMAIGVAIFALRWTLLSSTPNIAGHPALSGSLFVLAVTCFAVAFAVAVYEQWLEIKPEILRAKENLAHAAYQRQARATRP